MKKSDGHKLYAKVELRSIFRAPSQNFKILAIPNVFANGKSYEHDFVKKRDGHKLCAKSHAELSFNWFFVKPCSYNLPWANTLGMASILKF
ncbi:hypothetical protein BHM03_00032368 [Ensete ventricosum]|nr:hypothetical protein BHM03_00032368 [Ensete ventricosum]